MILLHGTIDRKERANAVAMDGGACRTITLFYQDQPHNKQIVEHYGKVHIEKTSNYQLMINCTV